MKNKAAVSSYWQASLQQEKLHGLTATNISAHWHTITAAECNSGQLAQQQLIKHLHAAAPIAVIPQYARYADNYFIPYVLLENVYQSYIKI